jgi:hypothetical protein
MGPGLESDSVVMMSIRPPLPGKDLFIFEDQAVCSVDAGLLFLLSRRDEVISRVRVQRKVESSVRYHKRTSTRGPLTKEKLMQRPEEFGPMDDSERRLRCRHRQRQRSRRW